MGQRSLSEVLNQAINEEPHPCSPTKLQQPTPTVHKLTARELHVADQKAGDEVDECLRHPTAPNLYHHLQFHNSNWTMVLIQAELRR